MKHASRPRSTSRLRVTLAAGGAGLVVLSGLFIGSGSASASSPDGRAAVTACAGDVVTVPASSFVTQDGVTTFANYLLPTTTVVTTQKYILGADGTPITSTVTSSVDTATGAMTVTIPAAETPPFGVFVVTDLKEPGVAGSFYFLLNLAVTQKPDCLPSTTEPSTTEPSTTEPSTTEPSTTEPSTTEPSTTEPSTTEPSTTEPSTTEPSTTEPSTTEPSTTEPSTTEPSTTEPSTTEPSTTEPSTTEPSTTEPSTTEPSTTTTSTPISVLDSGATRAVPTSQSGTTAATTSPATAAVATTSSTAVPPVQSNIAPTAIRTSGDELVRGHDVRGLGWAALSLGALSGGLVLVRLRRNRFAR